ncbi:MAG: hypothetical protein A2070_14045 [Bdellovibrionales bacterium GWC1_52_8]|nr:MAG: hypothetical protein A2Z97_06280 [Bdellovibrionales bacterium GWB1_52_6]OFZ06109.1 MAG: hypothetical protein A2X97_02120 [Bdellovibrionales bacterium GWA1_52_35]OFZ42277.1 MAG: hypothetical protein A2070_14045 [Bdellovibrionales bacterium GWC1_52_8]HCM39262.1 hypothetical protein [Bdellovibrionales bacterium]
MKIFLSVIFLSVISMISSFCFSAQAADVRRCWQLETEAEPIPFELPSQICIEDASVQWREDYPSHNVLITGSPITGAFELNELGDGETNDSILVQATLKTQIQRDATCFMKRGAFIRFRFEVSINARTVYNSKLWIDYFQADEHCRFPQGPRTIAYLPIE